MQTMSYFRSNKAALLLLLMVSCVSSPAMARAVDSEDEALLVAFLFPAEGSLNLDSSAASTYQAPTKAFSGFSSDNQRKGWTTAQVDAMRSAFKQHGEVGTITGVGEGRPVRHSLMPSDTSPYAALVTKYAKLRNLDPGLVHHVILAESQYNPNAVSPKGAKGLMQLMDGLSEQFNIDPFDPEENINVGTQYLADMLSRFKSVDLALAAYNAGPGAVQKYNGIPPYKETQDYVSRIKAGLEKMEAKKG